MDPRKGRLSPLRTHIQRISQSSMTAEIPRPVLYVMIGGFFLAAMLGILLVLIFLATLFISGFGGTNPRFPVDDLRSLEQIVYEIDAESGRAALGAWSFEVGENSVTGKGGLEVLTLPVNALPNSDSLDLVDRLFAVEWMPYTILPSNTAAYRVVYELDQLPAEIQSLPLQLYLYDGVEWLALPTDRNETGNRLSAEIRQPGIFGLVIHDDTPQPLNQQLRVQGEVYYMDGIAQTAEGGEPLPLANARYALITREDRQLIAEGYLDEQGRFDLSLNAELLLESNEEVTHVILRVYAEEHGVVSVRDGVTTVSARYAYDSEPLALTSSSITFRFPSLTIPLEASGAFNILASIQRGFSFTEETTRGWRPPQLLIAWSDPSDRGRWDTGFSPQTGVVYLGKSPQVAWDDDFLLAIYGHFLLHWLPETDATTCIASWSGPERATEACSAWAEGWGYFFSSMVRQDPGFTAYKNSLSVKTSFNLENGTGTYHVDSPGAVMQVLWDMVDTGDDGEVLQYSIERIIQTIAQQGDAIQDIQGFYAAWLDTFGMDTALCTRFSEQGYLEAAACGSTALRESRPPTLVPRASATPAPTELTCGAEQRITLPGDNLASELDFLPIPGRITTLFIEDIDLDGSSILQVGLFTVDGEPLNTYTIRTGEPQYSISIPDDVVASSAPVILRTSSDGLGDVTLRLNCEQPPTPTPLPSPTPSPTPTEIPEPTPIAGLGSGEVQITLLWYSRVDLDLHATTPSGVTIFYENRAPQSGGFLDRDSNGFCATAVSNPIENIYWPVGTAEDGEYSVNVVYFSECLEDQGEQAFELIVRANGRVIEQVFGTVSPGDDTEVLRFQYP